MDFTASGGVQGLVTNRLGQPVPNFTLHVSSPTNFTVTNKSPTINAIADATMSEDTPVFVNFTVGDVDSPDLNTPDVSVSSGADFLVAANNVAFGGTGSSRFLTVTPNPDEAGTVTLNVKVLNVDGGAANECFDLRIEPAPKPRPARKLSTSPTARSMWMTPPASGRATRTPTATAPGA